MAFYIGFDIGGTKCETVIQAADAVIFEVEKQD